MHGFSKSIDIHHCVFGIIGFIVGKLTGFNPTTAYSDIGSIVIILPFMLIKGLL